MKLTMVYVVLMFLLFMGTYYSFERGGGGSPDTSKMANTGEALRMFQAAKKADISNPASKYCIEKGGIFVIKKLANEEEYGVCMFSNNRECEEWALFRDECPIGGVSTRGYSEEQTYCVISGGVISGDKGEYCIFSNGKTCDVEKLFLGNCER